MTEDSLTTDITTRESPAPTPPNPELQEVMTIVPSITATHLKDLVIRQILPQTNKLNDKIRSLLDRLDQLSTTNWITTSPDTALPPYAHSTNQEPPWHYTHLNRFNRNGRRYTFATHSSSVEHADPGVKITFTSKLGIKDNGEMIEEEWNLTYWQDSENQPLALTFPS